MEERVWLHPRHFDGTSCQPFSGQGKRFEALRQMLQKAIEARDAWHPRDSRLLVQVQGKELHAEGLAAISLHFTDLVWSSVDEGRPRGKLFESPTEIEELRQEKWVFCLAPRWNMMEMGTAKGIDADVEDVWFLCASLSAAELEHFVSSMTRVGALRWDFQEAFLLTKRVLGSGGFSTVYDGLSRSYLAADRGILEDDEEELLIRGLDHHPTYVALKCLRNVASAEGATSVLTEIYFLSLCGSHPSITTLLGTFLVPQRYKTSWIICMERYSQGRLSDYVEACGPLLLSRGDVMAISLLSAVAFLHSKDIIHRDIRPEKVLLSDHFAPVLVDLGQAAHLGDSVAMMRRLGTAGYVAPEVLDTRSPGYGSLSDVFSIGCVLFYLYSGVEAFRDVNYSMTLQRSLAGKARFNHPKTKQVRSGTLHLLKKMLAVSPKKRPKAHKACTALWNVGDEEVKESLQAVQAVEHLPGSNDAESYGRLLPVMETLREEQPEPDESLELVQKAKCHTLKSMPPGAIPSEVQVPRPPSTQSARGSSFFSRFKRRSA